MEKWKIPTIDEDKVKTALIIAVWIIWFAYLYYSFCYEKPIPHSTCEWHYIGDTIVTDCGYKITDGCPNCGRKIRISEQEEAGNEKNNSDSSM